MIGNRRQERFQGASRCERAREWSSLRVDDEISDVERLLLRRHLARCADCRAFAESLDTITTTLRASERQQPGRELIARAPARRRRARMRLRLGVALVVVAAGLGALAGFLRSGGGTGEPGPGPGPAEIAQLPPAPPSVPATPEESPVGPGNEPIAPV